MQTTAPAQHHRPLSGPVAAIVTAIMLGLLIAASCSGGSDDNTNDGSSVKPAQDAFGDEYDRRRRRSHH